MKAESVGGLFTIVSKHHSIADPVVIGLTGKLTKEELKPLVIEQIKLFCCRSWCGHRYTEKFPDGFEPAYSAALSNFPNGYLVLEPEEYHGYKLIRKGSFLYPIKEKIKDDIAVYYNACAPVDSGLNGNYQWSVTYSNSHCCTIICTYHEIVEKLDYFNKDIKTQIWKNKNNEKC